MANDLFTTEYRRVLRQQIFDTFNIEEFKTLCDDVNIRYDNLESDGLEAKVRELIGQLYRRGRLPELIQVCERDRPNQFWDPLTIGNNPISQKPERSAGQLISQIAIVLSQISLFTRIVAVILILGGTYVLIRAGEKSLTIGAAIIVMIATIGASFKWITNKQDGGRIHSQGITTQLMRLAPHAFFIALPLCLSLLAQPFFDIVATSRINAAISDPNLFEAQKSADEAYVLSPKKTPALLRNALRQMLKDLDFDSNGTLMPRIAHLYKVYAAAEPDETTHLTADVFATICQIASVPNQEKLVRLVKVGAILDPKQMLRVSLELNDVAVSFVTMQLNSQNANSPLSMTTPICWPSSTQGLSMTMAHARVFLELASEESFDKLMDTVRLAKSRSITLANLGVVRELFFEDINHLNDAAIAYRKALNTDQTNLAARYRLASLLLWYSGRITNTTDSKADLQSAVEIAHAGWNVLNPPSCETPPAVRDINALLIYAYCIQFKATEAGALLSLDAKGNASEVQTLLDGAVADYERDLLVSNRLDELIGGEIYYWHVKMELANGLVPNKDLICRGRRTMPATLIRRKWLDDLKKLTPAGETCPPPTLGSP